MENDNKNGLRNFIDWVNADENLPTLEELEQSHHHEEHAGHTEEHAVHAEEHENHAGTHDSVHPIHEDGKRKEGRKSKAKQADIASVMDLDENEAGDKPVLADMEEKLPEGKPLAAPEALTIQTLKKASLLAKEEKKKVQDMQFLYAISAGFMAVLIIVILLVTTADLPEFGSPDNPTINEVYTRYVEKGTEETGAINVVAGMILDYRAFDTLGESVMLFTAISAVIMLIRAPKNNHSGESGKEGRV